MLVTKDLRLVDGHRRVAVCESLGWEEIQVLVTASEDVETVYADVNSTSMGQDGNDLLHIFFENPKALTDPQRQRCQRALSDLGEGLLRRMQKSGTTLVVWAAAVSLRKYCSQDHSFVRKAVNWFLKFGSVTAVNQAKARDIPPAKIIAAVAKGKPLVVEYKVDAED